MVGALELAHWRVCQVMPIGADWIAADWLRHVRACLADR